MEGGPVPIGEVTGEEKVSPAPAIFVDFTLRLSISLAPSGWECSEGDAARLRTLLLPAELPPFQLQARLVADQQLNVLLRFSLESERDSAPLKARVEGLLSGSPGATGVARALLHSSTCTAHLLSEVTASDGQGAPLALREASPPAQQAHPARFPLMRPGGVLLLTEREHLELLGWAPRHLSASERDCEEFCKCCLESLGSCLGAICCVVKVLVTVLSLLSILGGGGGHHVPLAGPGGGASAAAQPQRPAITLRLCSPAVWVGALAGAVLAVALSGAPLALRLLLLALPLAVGAARSARWLYEDCRGARVALEVERPQCPYCSVCAEATWLAVVGLCTVWVCKLLAVVLPPPLGLIVAALVAGVGAWIGVGAWMPLRPSHARRLALRLAVFLFLAALTLAAANWHSFAGDMGSLLRQQQQQ
jgi:hypothetical protein